MCRGHDSNNARLFKRTHSNADHESRTVLSRVENASICLAPKRSPLILVDLDVRARHTNTFVAFDI